MGVILDKDRENISRRISQGYNSGITDDGKGNHVSWELKTLLWSDGDEPWNPKIEEKEEEKSDLFPVENYGDMLAKVLESNLVYFKEYGSYQGEYLAVLERNGVFELYFDYYGSCSGCDWLEAEQEYNYKTGKNEISYKLALEYCNQLSNKLIIPVSVCKHINHKAQKKLSKFIEEKIGNFEEEDKGELFEILEKYNLKKE